MKIVLLTDGSPREIPLDWRTINFKKVPPKHLLAKGKVSRLAVQALQGTWRKGCSVRINPY
ncbi:DUF6088 family protein, partial [Dyadobacter tibetensis]|uniref:DUF6088 family protein n=1 Tax=Dyadobacter tibetensis TaxID=1211851 RepID=UPI001E2D3041